MIALQRLCLLFLYSTLLCGCSVLSNLSGDDELVEPTGGSAEELAQPEVSAKPLTPAPQPPEKETVSKDLWQSIRSDFKLTEPHNKHIAKYIKWYASHQSYIDRVTERGQRYLYFIAQRLKAKGMPLEFAFLPVVESAFDPFAYSHGRASGMWQFLSGTASDYGLKQNWWYDGRRDVVASTNAALNYLQQLHDMFNDDWLLALAAYNTGQGNLQRAIRRNRRAGKPINFWSLKLPRETRAYVPQLLALSRIIADPKKYHITLPPLANAPYFVAVDVNSQIDLAQAADLAGISMDELYLLNPGYNRWATDPNGPHKLLVPVADADKFSTGLDKIPLSQRVSWERYQIRSGDSLGQIAHRYNTSVSALKSANQLRSSRIRAGDTLLIPEASEPGKHYAYSKPQRRRRTQSHSRGSSGSQKFMYTVHRGDSLWRIANRNKVSVSSLARWNGMAPKDKLMPGQKLVVWSKARGSGKGVVRKLAYTVRNGDSLSQIADQFNVSINDITRWNSVSSKSYIHPGQLLTLFVDVTRAD